MMNTGNYDLKSELQAQAQLQPVKDTGVKLTKDMSIPDMVRAMAPELKKALPSVMSPERFTRIALSALNNTPQLKQCTPHELYQRSAHGCTAGAGTEHTPGAGIPDSL